MTAIDMFRGDALTYKTQLFQLNQAQDPSAPRLPMDLTGAKVIFTAKKYASDPDNRAVSQVDTVGGGVAIVAPAINGYVTVTMPAQATVGFPDTPVTLIYDIKVIKAGIAQTPESGMITVEPNATRATA